MKPPSEAVILTKLREVFGYESFREEQKAIIQHVLMRKDAFVMMPTGGGKSLCYQIPALLQDGLAIVISPLIALMKDQVDQLQKLGIYATLLNSTLSAKTFKAIREDMLANKVKILYLGPETLANRDKLDFLRHVNVSFIAVDEAHCISDWGHDFRPEYRKIHQVTQAYLGRLPMIALTATATPRVQLDILRSLEITEATIFKSSFNRPNLYYEIRAKEPEPEKQLIRFIKKQPDQGAGIVYCQSRREVEHIANLLNINGIAAAPYHAALTPRVRVQNQENFLNRKIDFIVGTIAFGMGIDKPDVRLVIHYDIPKALESYYQETGRAGRDGLPSTCLMLFSLRDIQRLERINRHNEESEKAQELLDEVNDYAFLGVCRRKQLLHYFGETYEAPCNYCDNCLEPHEHYEGAHELKAVLDVVKKNPAAYRPAHIVQTLQKNIDLSQAGHTYEYLAVISQDSKEYKGHWKPVVKQALLSGFLYTDVEQGQGLQLTAKGQKFLKRSHSVKLIRNHVYTSSVASPLKIEKIEKVCDEGLLDQLQKLRADIASEKGIPPYAVMQDASLEEMTIYYPTTLEDLAQISGLSMSKATKFGLPFLQHIEAYVVEKNIIISTDVLVKAPANASRNKVYIIQHIDRKVSLEEIAASKMMTMEELIEEIEHICNAGLKLNLNYYIDTILTQDQQQEVYAYFMHAEQDDIRQAHNAMGNRYEIEELRLMRVKFLSEIAN